jgi:hypothetical protein
VAEDRLLVTGHKFYCTIRANHFVNRGSWFFEAKITDLPEGAATRIGWAQKYANLQVNALNQSLSQQSLKLIFVIKLSGVAVDNIQKLNYLCIIMTKHLKKRVKLLCRVFLDKILFVQIYST